MAAVVRARNELVRVAIQIDPPKAIVAPSSPEKYGEIC